MAGYNRYAGNLGLLALSVGLALNAKRQGHEERSCGAAVCIDNAGGLFKPPGDTEACRGTQITGCLPGSAVGTRLYTFA